jgi:hypothetical protein
VLTVQPRRRLGRDDEELRAVCVRAGVRHRERAAGDAVLVELVLELVTRPARAGAGRIASLDHEVGDHAVEDHALVEPVAGKLQEVLDRLRRVVGVELDLDRAFARLEGRGAHGMLSASGSRAPAVGWSSPDSN